MPNATNTHLAYQLIYMSIELMVNETFGLTFQRIERMSYSLLSGNVEHFLYT